MYTVLPPSLAYFTWTAASLIPVKYMWVITTEEVPLNKLLYCILGSFMCELRLEVHFRWTGETSDPCLTFN